MHFNLAVAIPLMLVTILIQSEAMFLVMRRVGMHPGYVPAFLRRTHIYPIAGVILVMFLAHVLQVMLWAAAYLSLGAIEDVEQALYFSMVTFTTLGYGDVVLDQTWRLLSSFEAAAGIIMFGWTTAIVVAVVHKIYLEIKAEDG